MCEDGTCCCWHLEAPRGAGGGSARANGRLPPPSPQPPSSRVSTSPRRPLSSSQRGCLARPPQSCSLPPTLTLQFVISVRSNHTRNSGTIGIRFLWLPAQTTPTSTSLFSYGPGCQESRSPPGRALAEPVPPAGCKGKNLLP